MFERLQHFFASNKERTTQQELVPKDNKWTHDEFFLYMMWYDV